MKTIEQTLKDFDVREGDRAGVIKLARSLHRVGITRRKSSTPYWQRQGFEDCNLARDIVTWVKWAKNPAAFAAFKKHFG